MRKGELETKNKAKEVARKTGQVKTSFLQSGLTLEGTPETSLAGIFDAGLEDIKLIKSNTDTQAKNIISAARTNAILGLATAGVKGGVASGAFGSFGETLSNKFTFGTNSFKGFGQSLAAGFDEDEIGPFQSPFT